MAFPADYERNRAAASLRRHYLLGRLSVDELSDRLDLALAARNQGDLRRALRGLPGPWSREEIQPLVETAGRAARRTVVFAALGMFWCVLSLMLLIAFVAIAATGGSGTELATVPLIWLVSSWLVWRAWHRGATR